MWRARSGVERRGGGASQTRWVWADAAAQEAQLVPICDRSAGACVPRPAVLRLGLPVISQRMDMRVIQHAESNERVAESMRDLEGYVWD